jgi:hypothetical protein
VGEREQERRREEGSEEVARHRGFVARIKDGGRHGGVVEVWGMEGNGRDMWALRNNPE